MKRNVVIIDHYDSFVHTIAYYVREFDFNPIVVRSTDADPVRLRELEPSALVLGPGPGSPAQTPYGSLIRTFGGDIPILGVCLGHQAIAAAYGGEVVRATEPIHGRTSTVFHLGGGVFHDLPNNLSATRYHSLVVEESSLPACLQVTARSVEDGSIMALRHRDIPIESVQFHPESIGTENGTAIMGNFLFEHVKEGNIVATR